MSSAIINLLASVDECHTLVKESNARAAIIREMPLSKRGLLPKESTFKLATVVATSFTTPTIQYNVSYEKEIENHHQQQQCFFLKEQKKYYRRKRK